MPRDGSRARRVADQVRRELAQLLARDVADPRVANVTINDVEMSVDLAHARIFVAFPADDDPQVTMAGLDAASGFLRRRLAPEIRLRVVPTLKFIHDTSMDNADRIEQLLAAARKRTPGSPEQ